MQRHTHWQAFRRESALARGTMPPHPSLLCLRRGGQDDLLRLYASESIREREHQARASRLLHHALSCNPKSVCAAGAQDDPPRPESESIKIVEAPRTVAYVASFGGFGVESNILSNAKELRAKLDAAGVRFDARPRCDTLPMKTRAAEKFGNSMSPPGRLALWMACEQGMPWSGTVLRCSHSADVCESLTAVHARAAGLQVLLQPVRPAHQAAQPV